MSANIHFVGMLRSPVSWAKVGRKLILALSGAGAHVSAASLKGFLYDEAFALEREVEAAVERKRLAGWDLALDYPPNFPRLTGSRRAGILIYEADRFPPHWAEAAKQHLDRAFVPSRFCLEAAAASGVPREMLVVAPFGVDTGVYRPDGPTTPLPTERAFNFLTVAAPHVRKGLAETTAAFYEAFSPAADVGLVIKCPPLEALGKRPWEYDSVEAFLSAGKDKRVSLIAGSLSEQRMAGLYRSCDAYVQASYGEGFGLSLLEAAACGKAVITTNCGGALDFLRDSNAFLVDCDPVDASSFAYDWPETDVEVRMARPRIGHLAEVMREAYEDAPRRSAVAAAGLETARAMTWESAARSIMACLGDS